MKTIGFSVGATIVVLIMFGLIIGGASVQAGNVGVLTTFGKVEPGVLQPGFHLIVPGFQQIVSISTRVEPHPFKQIDAASSEYQAVKLTGTMNYHLQAERANELYQTVGLSFANSVIDPAFNDFIKEVVPQYEANTILGKRDEIRSKAKQQLGDNLARYGIIVDDIYISNISFSDDYQAAIEKKQTAQQNVEAERQILAQKGVQAQQAVAEAKGLAEAQVARANGEAEANNALNASITPALTEYRRWAIKWDGKLPAVTGSGGIIVDMPSAPAAPAR